jgi:hypothetical protein
VTVPTVDLGFAPVVFCSIEMAGDRPSIRSTLALGVDRVERERRLAGSGEAGDDHQPVAGDVDVDVLEVVDARAAHRDPVVRHG